MSIFSRQMPRRNSSLRKRRMNNKEGDPVKRATKWLQEAEAQDGYLAKCRKDASNSSARRACSYTVWPDQGLAEKLASRGYASKIIIMHPSCEGGMPHTRPGGVICLPAYFPDEKLERTMRHEHIHIWQRDAAEEWETLCQRDGWRKIPASVAESEIPLQWLERCRLNPDTVQSRWWAWQGTYIPLPLFTRTDKPDLHDIVIRWYDRISGRVLTSPPTSYTRRYGSVGPAMMEHPFEWAAYQMEKPSL